MISFIIPVYNGEKYIERCVGSIINNTGGTYEIIVIDDGSTDNTLEIINELKGECNFIKVISQKNAGVSSARERGVESAHGEWIVFVDADDYVISDISKFIRAEQDNQYDWIVFSGQIDKSLSFDLRLTECKMDIITAILNQNQQHIIRLAKLNAVWSKAYRKSIIEENHIQFEKTLIHGEDMVFNIDYIKHCKRVYICPESVYMLCANEESATHSYQKDCVKSDKEFYSQLYKRGLINQDVQLADWHYRMVLNGIWICLGRYFSHPQNKKRLSEKKQELATLLSQEPYRTALANFLIEKNKRRKITYALLYFRFYKTVLKIMERLSMRNSTNIMGSKAI